MGKCKCSCKGATSSKGSKGDPGSGAIGDGESAQLSGFTLTSTYTSITGATFTLAAGTYLFWFEATAQWSGDSEDGSTNTFIAFYSDASLLTERNYSGGGLAGQGIWAMAMNMKITVTGTKTITVKAKDTNLAPAIIFQSLQYVKLQ